MHTAPHSSPPYGQSHPQPWPEASAPQPSPEASAPQPWSEASAPQPWPEANVARPGAGGPGPTHPTWHAPYGQHPYPVPPPDVHAWLDYHGAPGAVVGSMWRPAAESGPPARLVAWGQRNSGPVGRVRRGTVLVGTLAAGLLATAAAMMLW